MSKAKAKGTDAEVAVVNYLREYWPLCERRTTEGKNDRGDISLHPELVIEVKNQQAMALAGWLDEATTEVANANARWGVVWHKRLRKGQPADWYVTMSGSTFRDFFHNYTQQVELLNQAEMFAKMVVDK